MKSDNQQEPSEPHNGGRPEPQRSGAPDREAEETDFASAVILDDYQVIRLLGQGGMGRVFLARCLATGELFAVKQILPEFSGDEGRWDLFMRELLNWSALPEHSNITGFRFFRSAGKEILIFAEYVAGDSLDQWVRFGRIVTVEQILDIAIQMAWGLHVAHEFGVIHQDVKPANILMSVAGQTKITDFGLSQARASKRSGRKLRAMIATGRAPSSPSTSDSVGITLAYCSPEQAMEQPLTAATDVWSWGLCVLFMMCGGLTWEVGPLAPAVMETWAAATDYGLIKVYHSELIGVLQRCFAWRPDDRWQSLAEAVAVLREIYQRATGQPYNRVLAMPEVPSGEEREHLRADGWGETWQDPRRWLRTALAAHGQEIDDPPLLTPPPHAARRAWLLADFIGFGQAQRLFEHLLEPNATQLAEFAQFCREKSRIHRSLGDQSGALPLLDKAVSILDGLVVTRQEPETIRLLARTLTDKALALEDFGDIHGAEQLYDRTIALLDQFITPNSWRHLSNQLARAWMNKSNIRRKHGDVPAAIAGYDRAIAIRERLVFEQGETGLTYQLAAAYLNKAQALTDGGNYSSAVAEHDRAISLIEKLVYQTDRGDLANWLATAYTKKAATLRLLQQQQDALLLYDQALTIFDRLIQQHGRHEILSWQADTLEQKADLLAELGRRIEADALYQQAAAVWDQLVNREGRLEFLPRSRPRSIK